MNHPPPRPPFHFHREIAPMLKGVDELCRELRAQLKAAGLGAASFEVELVARECLNNAVIHGSAGDPSKPVTFDLRSGRDWLCGCVTDQGAGFNWRRTGRPRLVHSCATRGRGLFIVASHAYRLRFNRQGNQVTFWLRKPQEQKARPRA